MQQRQVDFSRRVLPDLQKQMQNGDIIFRMGNDITSALFARINDEDQRFSHCGMLSFENNSWYVYHAIGGELNPDEAMWREPLEWFASPDESRRIGLFSTGIATADTKRMLTVVRGWYGLKLPFDMGFDLQTNDRMYCTEMVSKAIIIGRGSADWLKTSHRGGKIYIDTEDLSLYGGLKQKALWEY